MPTPTDLRRTAAIGLIDSETGLPAWAVDDSESVRTAGIAALDLWNAKETLEETVGHINGNDDLNVEGRKRRVASAAEAFVKVEVAIAEGKLQGLERALLNAQAAVVIPRPEGNEVVIAMRAAEIRQQLRALGGVDLVAAAITAAQRGDNEVLHALQDAPGERLLDDENWAKIRAEYFSIQEGELVARVERLERAQRGLAGQIESARRRAAQLGAENAMKMTAA